MQVGPGLLGGRLGGGQLLGELGELAVLRGQGRPEPIDLDLVRLRVEAEQHVALLERLVRLDRHLDDDAPDLGDDLNHRRRTSARRG